MAATNVTITIVVDSTAFDRTMQKLIEHDIALAVEPVAARMLRKRLAELNEKQS